jgi:glycosyltransferase involved in cell wall biosynthesis
VGARLARKPAVVVSGGFDVASLPELDYGRMVHPLTRNMSRLALRAATRVLAVSHFNAAEVERWAPGTSLEVLPHGFEAMSPPRPARETRVVSVGTISWEYMLRKGLEDFAKASTAMPEVEFVLAGKHVHADAVEHLRGMGGPNLRLPGFLPAAELDELLGSSAVYLQLSRHEAFGCSVAEAMLAGCTPVLTRDGALPEVAGDAAYYVASRDPGAVAEAVGVALAHPTGQRCHERIGSAYPIEARRRRLHEIVAELLPEAGTGS